MNKIKKIINDFISEHYSEKVKDGTFSEFIDDWKWIFSFSKRYKYIIVFYTLLGIFSSTFSIGSVYASSLMINIITGKQIDKLPLLVIISVSTNVFSLLFSSVMSRISTKISIYVNNDIQGEIFDSIVDVKWAELNKYKYGDLLNRFNGDVSAISNNVVSWIPNVIINIYTFIITFIIIYKMDHIMAWIAMLSAPILLILSRCIMRKQKEYRLRVLELNSNMMAFEMDSFYNMDNVKAFGVWPVLSKTLREWQAKYKMFNLQYNMFQIKTNIATTVLSALVAYCTFGYSLFLLWTGQILYGDMTFFIRQRLTLSTRFNKLVTTIPDMLNSAVSAHRVREIVSLQREEHNEELYRQMSEKSVCGLTVEMKGVDFSYTDGCRVYENTDFTAHPGEIVAVLGESGGGKTTLFRLLLGLVEPDGGAVVLRDCNGEAVNMNADLRRLVSYVPQGNTMILGTIAENMRMVKEDATDEEIIDVLKVACAWDFVEKIGINSQLGEHGKGISEGQAQRISIARAILRNAPILLLDEATSALDEATESKVITNLMSRLKDKTVIVSTHRPGILSNCNRIYKITNKKISESE